MTQKALCAVAILLLGSVSACGDDEPNTGPPLRTVVQETVGTAGGQASRTFSGTAASGRTVNLSFRTGGVINELNIQLGQRVRRGDLIARLDDVSARLAYEQAVVSRNGAESQMNTASLALDRTRKLYESGTASLSDYENARNAFRTAEASFQSAERSVQIQEEAIEFGVIYAPDNGTIASVNVEIDENVSAGQSIGLVNVDGDLEVALGLPESVITRVAVGMATTIAFPAVPDRTFEGVVTEASPSVDPATATYPVRVAVTDAGSQVRPGMAANVTLNLDTDLAGSTALVVPAKAVAEDGNGRFVFVVEPTAGEEATVRKQPVTVGRLTSAGFEILDGLSAGDRIATAGIQTLIDGQRVRIRDVGGAP